MLAQADGDRQRVAVGDQIAGRVGFFLRVEHFETTYRRMVDRGVTFVTEPKAATPATVGVSPSGRQRGPTATTSER
jgi:hypothetical protein